MKTSNKRTNEKTGKLEVLSSIGGLPAIWLTAGGTEKHELCSKCIPYGKCMGFSGGYEETRLRKKMEGKKFLEEVFSKIEERPAGKIIL